MRIGIDIDDTIADTYEVAFAYAQLYTIKDLGKNATVINKPSMHHSYLKEMHNWNQEEELNFWRKYYPQILKKARPFTFAQEIVDKLKEEENEIIFITARWSGDNYNIEEITRDWLKENNIIYDDVFFNIMDKGKAAKNQKLDLFIDDSFQNCKSVANTGIKTFIIESRTNKGLKDDNITRVYSWPDIYSRIKKEESKWNFMN